MTCDTGNLTRGKETLTFNEDDIRTVVRQIMAFAPGITRSLLGSHRPFRQLAIAVHGEGSPVGILSNDESMAPFSRTEKKSVLP